MQISKNGIYSIFQKSSSYVNLPPNCPLQPYTLSPHIHVKTHPGVMLEQQMNLHPINSTQTLGK